MALQDKLLGFFGVSSHQELVDYIQKNPKDEKVIVLVELLKKGGVNLDGSK